MDKNRICPVQVGKGVRMSYARQKEILEMPNLIEVQKDSYNWFLKKGLHEVFEDISPIEDYSGQFKLRLPKSLHKRLAEKSGEEGVSMNQYCVYLLSKGAF